MSAGLSVGHTIHRDVRRFFANRRSYEKPMARDPSVFKGLRARKFGGDGGI